MNVFYEYMMPFVYLTQSVFSPCSNRVLVRERLSEFDKHAEVAFDNHSLCFAAQVSSLDNFFQLGL